MYKLAGTVKVVNSTVQVSPTFSKREFVLSDTSGMYPQDILFQLTQDKCTLLDGVNVNDQIEVSFNLRGKEWTNPQGEVKYFNSLDAWRIDKVGTMSQGISANGHSPLNLNPVVAAAPEMTTSSSDDDLPF
jgi:hypothetical protein